MKVDDFYLLYCKIKDRFLVAVGLTTVLSYAKIDVYCRHCGNFHEFSMRKDGNFRVVTH